MPIENEIAKILTSPEVIAAAPYILGAAGLTNLYKDFASPTIKAAGLLGAKIFTALTISADVWAEKRVKRFKDLQDDVTNILINKNVEDISSTPPAYIIAPAISSYMYSMDKEELRNMYAKLISKAMLNEYDDKIHPGIVNILQNLHPQETLLLSLLSTQNSVPIIETHWKKKDLKGYRIQSTNIYLIPKKVTHTISESVGVLRCEDFVIGNPAFLSNLNRLGMIKLSYSEFLVDEHSYAALENLEEVTNEKKICEASDFEFVVARGMCQLTPLGSDFINICIN